MPNTEQSVKPEKKQPEKLTKVLKVVRRTLAGATVVGLLSGRMAAEAQYHASGVYDKDVLSSFEPQWTATDDTHLPIRQPLSVVRDISYMNSNEALDESYTFLTDEAGFQIVNRPAGAIHAAAYPADQQSLVLELQNAAEQNGQPGYTIHVGDSYLQTLPSRGYQNNMQWQDAWTVGGAGPQEYLEAVRHRFADLSVNQTVLTHLASLPEGSPVTIALYITPHNDLEGMVGQPLFTPQKVLASPSKQEKEWHWPSSRREFLRITSPLWRAWLGVNSYEKEKSLRAVLDTLPGSKQLTGNPADLQPSPADGRVQDLAQLSRGLAESLVTQFPQLRIGVDITVFPSYYDTDLRGSWAAVLHELETVIGGQEKSVTVVGYNLTQYVTTYLQLTDEPHQVLFQPADQHYSPRGVAVVSVALQWMREGKKIDLTTLGFFTQEVEKFFLNERQALQ